MNERIKELAEQVYGSAHHDDFRFAELIVLECIEKITTYDLVPGHSAKWEDIYDIHASLLQDLGEELKEHFGVEE
jgi:hypothetical protein